MATEGEYVSTLDGPSLVKAQSELHEDPKNRLGAVDALRTWINQQPHLTCKSDIHFLLRFLRYCKFSQLEARKRLEKFLTSMVKYSDWMGNIDPYDPGIVEVLKLGYIVPLPGRDEGGRKVVLFRLSAFDPKTADKVAMFKASVMVFYLMLLDENVSVNGIVYVIDMTDVELKHQTFWSIEDMKRNTDLFSHGFPARLKEFHYYNIGSVAETMIQLFLPFLNKKFRERITLHGDNLESLYKVVPMYMLPDEYLPDEHRGRSAGSITHITDSLIRELHQPSIAQYIADMTSLDNYSVDESKRPHHQELQASFRKLNID